MQNYLFNGWNWVHLFGSLSLCVFMVGATKRIKAGIIITLLLGFLWECADQVMTGFFPLFDPYGFDYRDLIMNSFGVSIAYILIRGFYAGRP